MSDNKTPTATPTEVAKRDANLSAEWAAQLFRAMKEQEKQQGLTGDQKLAAVKEIMYDAFGDVFGEQPWMKNILDSMISLLVEVDRADQSLNLRKPSGCCSMQ